MAEKKSPFSARIRQTARRRQQQLVYVEIDGTHLKKGRSTYRLCANSVLVMQLRDVLWKIVKGEGELV
jgi:hypothetical protein